MKKVRFFDPGKAYRKNGDFKREIDRVLRLGDLILRQDVEIFEKTLADFCGTKYAVALNSGTDALYLALWHLGIKAGDEVLVPSHTFVATAQVVAQLGGTPVLYDIGEIPVPTPNTKAIMVAHIAGEFMCDMNKVMELGLPVIEDACQALGATQYGRKAGSIGLAGAFSFYPAKILGAYGDAGGLVTNDEAMYKAVLELRNHWKSDYSRWGINSRLDNVQAAVLNVKMRLLPQTLARRQEIAEIYSAALTEEVGKPDHVEGRVWQDYIITTPCRDDLYEYLKEKGIETMKNEYPFPISKLPNSVAYEKNTLRLPINEVLTNAELQRVIKTINGYFG